MCLKESSFPDCWKVSSLVPVFMNDGEKSSAENYHPVSLLSVVSKVFGKLVINRLADHLEKCDLFSFFQYGFSSFNQLQIFWQLCLRELLGFLIGLGLPEL